MQVVIAIPNRPGAPTPSIPYKRGTTLECAIQLEEEEEHVAIQFSVEGTSPQNGVAVIVSETELTESGTIRLFGQTQTVPGHSAQLRVVAMCGLKIWHSERFSVCAHPAAVVNGPESLPHYSNDGGIRVGMYVTVGVVSDSGVTGDLDAVDGREQVSEIRDQSPALARMALQTEIGKFESASGTRYDRHRLAVELIGELNNDILRGQPAHWSNDQLDIFFCRRCGMVEAQPAVVPNSGYRITRAIHCSPPNRLRITVTKHAHDCTVGEYRTGPGPSAPCTVTLDVEQTAPNELQRLALLNAVHEIRG